MTAILSRTCFLLALGTSFAIAPALSDFQGTFSYEQAQAAKGGNGNGNSGNAGNGSSGNAGNGSSGNANNGKSGNASNGKSVGASNNANAANGQKITVGTTPDVSSQQKLNAEQTALTDPSVPAHPSQLGRWNAAKPITHPAIQAHIRNGNFKGTIGMVAAYAQAQTTYNGLEGDLAAAQAVIDAAKSADTLASALADGGYADLAAYEAAGVVDPAIDQAKLALGDQIVPTPEEIEAANALLLEGEKALTDLAAAEANMEAYSNRAPWSEIRDDVRARMGLDPTENDLAPTVVEEAVAQ